jgi:hypothetical protein
MIGPHIIGSTGGYERLIRRWQPRVALLLDPSQGAAAQVKQWSPNTFVIGRVFVDDQEIERRILGDPASAAAWGAQIIRDAAVRNPEVDVWQFNNEVAQTSPDDIGKLATFSMGYIDSLAQANLRAAIGGFSVGRPEAPTLDGSAAWNAFVPAMRHGMRHNAVLLLHAYGAPGIFDKSPDWYLYRYETVVRPHLPQDVASMPYVYGEYGCDMGVADHTRRGWKTGYAGDVGAFVRDLSQAAAFLSAQKNCLGACIFTLGVVNPDWLDFDISGDPAENFVNVMWPAPKVEPVIGPIERPIDEEAPSDLRDAMFQHEKARPLVDFTLSSALLPKIVEDGFVPVSPEFALEFRGIGIKAQRAEHPASGAMRIYCIRRDRPKEVGFVQA